jgi:hypothetical protein
MSIEAMKMALAKFEHLWEIGIDAEYRVELLPEIQALRQAIEQAEKQEPAVEHLWECLGRWSSYLAVNGTQANMAPPNWLLDAVKVATSQTPKREWVGLTDDEIALYDKRLSGSGVARDIEAKLKEKNNAL